MRERNTGTRFPSLRYPVATWPYVVDRWGMVTRINKAEEAITRRLVSLPKLAEVRHAG